MTEPQLKMPRACISCIHYHHIGFDQDQHCPFPPDYLGRKSSRTQYGTCIHHHREVFATQICNNHEPEPFVVLTDVLNRPEPRVALQEKLL